MNTTMPLCLCVSLALGVWGFSPAASAQESAMTFFITSAGPGQGADLAVLTEQTGTVRGSHRRREPGTTPGAPISARRPLTASRPLMPVTALGGGRGRTPRASPSPTISRNSTAPTI